MKVESVRTQMGRTLMPAFPLTVDEACRLLGRSRPGVYHTLKTLGDAGAVEIRRDPEERRRYLYHLVDEAAFRRVMDLPDVGDDDLPLDPRDRIVELIRRKESIERSIQETLRELLK